MSVKDVDGHKLSLYPREVSKSLEGDKDHSLLQVEIGVTNACNHKCNYCSLDWVNRENVFVNRDSMLSALDDMAEMGVRAVYFAGEGEPLLHKDLPEFVKRSSDLGMGVSMSTNGTLLTEEMSHKILPYLNWVRVGIDAATENTYSLIHGTRKENFKKVMDNITHAARIKKIGGLEVDIGVQSLLLSENLLEVEDLTRMVKETGVDNIQIKPFAQQPLAKERTDLVDYKDSYSKGLKQRINTFSDDSFVVVYRDKSMERTTVAGEYKECQGLDFWTLTDARGNVLPCNMHYDKQGFSFGNFNEKSFKEIWEGTQRKEVLGKLNRKECLEYICRPDLLNRHMDRLNRPEKNDCFI